MKKLIKIILFFSIFWFVSSFWYSWDIKSDWENTLSWSWNLIRSWETINENNSQWNITSKKNTTLEIIESVKNENDKKIEETDKKLSDVNNSIEENKVWINSLSNILKELEVKIESFNLDINNLNQKNKELLEKDTSNLNEKELINKNNQIIWVLKEKIKELNKDISYYKDQEKILLKEKFEKEELLKNYIELKKTYENIIKEQDLSRLFNILIYLFTLILSWILYYLYIYIKYKKEQKENKNTIKRRLIKLNVIYSFLFLFSLIVAFFYIYPSALVYLIFIASALIIIFKELIISFVLSIQVVSKYKIWDIIEIKWKDIIWKITNISLTDLELFILDEKHNYINEKIRLPHFNIFNSNISLKNWTNLINDSFSFYIKKIDNYNDSILKIEAILSKNINHYLKNYIDENKRKFKKIIKIKESKILVTYFWNDISHNNLKIKEELLELLIQNWFIDQNEKKWENIIEKEIENN